MELIILYHGTKFKYVADKILKEGFKEWTYFATDIGTAISQGGKYVFEVVFITSDLPDNWQVRCENKIIPERIVGLTKYDQTILVNNKKLRNEIFSNALEFPVKRDYCFKEENKFTQHPGGGKTICINNINNQSKYK